VKLPPSEEVKPPPSEEVKSPRHKVERQPVVPVRAPLVNVLDASFLVKMLHQAFVKLGKVAVHLAVQQPTHPATTVMMMAASTSPAPAPALAPTPNLTHKDL
jgi:hypothetical protein